MTENLLQLFQLCDSNFPSGAFNHSFGFETYINEEEIIDAHTFAKWLDIYLKDQIVTSDGLALRMTYEALENRNTETVWQIDRLLFVQNMAHETRDGTRFIGKSLTRIADAIYEAPLIKKYQQRILKKQSYGHAAIVYAILGQFFGISKDAIISLYLYNTVINFVQNAVRAIPLGQTDGQRIVNLFLPKIIEATKRIMHLDEIEFGTVAPGIELAQMRHEYAKARMFMS